MVLIDYSHKPVLLQEVISGLKIQNASEYIDATFGGGGHSREILRHGGIVLGIDQDINAINFSKSKFKAYIRKHKLVLSLGNFKDLKEIANKSGFKKIKGIIFDLGLSNYQIEKSNKGFSYKRVEVLDMRMGDNMNLTASDILNKFSKEQLYEIFTKYSEELNSRSIIEAIFRTRTLKGGIYDTKELISIIDREMKKKYFKLTNFEYQSILIKTLARIFQALRIYVNNELEYLRNGLEQAIDLLTVGGRLTIISYHSLEDRTVKLIFKREVLRKRFTYITKAPIVPSPEEIISNQKSRSGKLRIIEKI